jgi:hypothetical protein
MIAAAALIPVTADRRRRGTSIAGARAVTRTRTSLLRPARELLLEPPDYWRLDRRGRRTHELTHFLKLGHDGLALYTELLSEFVNPDLRHYSPLPPRRPACQSVGFKYRIIGRSGAECAPSRPQSRSFIALCSSSAHQLLDLLSVQVFRSRPVRFPSKHRRCDVRRRQLCYARVTACERYEASASTASGPVTRSARGNARRRCASSRHSGLGCRYAPRPGSLA